MACSFTSLWRQRFPTPRTQANEAQQRSTRAITTSRIWLTLIAIATLVIAGLIVWLFVHRYVVSRLDELADSMLSIARGNLTTPIPAAGPDELGEMSRALSVFRDNARGIQIAKDQAIEARAEAEAASRAKSSFLANMSHELRTPLNAIIGYSEILAEDATDRGDESAVQDLQKIQSAGKHLLGLINSILDLSKIEAGRMDVYLEPVNLTKLIDEVRGLVQPLIEKNGNRLTIDCPPDAGSMRTDLTKVKQSLVNLLSNAAKFTQNGEIGLAVTRQAAPSGDTHVLFKVSDNGIGMTEEQMGRLFEAFAQADASTTRHFGGTGLGLAITRRFATLLGGTITVTSKPGAGSTFTLDLLDQSFNVAAQNGGSIEAADTGPEGAALTVLVVDDDPAVHDVLTATLARKGYRVLHARDGAQALDILRKTPADVVTLDVMMPNVDGWTVLGTMKSDPTLAHIPVIMLTIIDDRNLGYSLGASEFMTKPVDRDRLLALVRRFTSRNENAVVLVVDDDAEVRNVVSATLNKVGLKTAEAINGRAAFEWLATHPAPDLVLLDLMMPEMDGFQFLDRLREQPERFAVPVVVLTAKDLTAEERAFLAERTVLVLSKSRAADRHARHSARRHCHPPAQRCKRRARASLRSSDAENSTGRRQRDEPGHAVAPAGSERLRGGHRGRWRKRRGDGRLGKAGPDPDGHEPSRDRRVGGDAPRESRPGDKVDPGDRADRSRYGGRQGKISRGRLRRLRHQTGGAAAPARKNSGASAKVSAAKAAPHERTRCKR